MVGTDKYYSDLVTAFGALHPSSDFGADNSKRKSVCNNPHLLTFPPAMSPPADENNDLESGETVPLNGGANSPEQPVFAAFFLSQVPALMAASTQTNKLYLCPDS
jgi:hypothetical protein